MRKSVQDIRATCSPDLACEQVHIAAATLDHIAKLNLSHIRVAAVAVVLADSKEICRACYFTTDSTRSDVASSVSNTSRKKSKPRLGNSAVSVRDRISLTVRSSSGLSPYQLEAQHLQPTLRLCESCAPCTDCGW